MYIIFKAGLNRELLLGRHSFYVFPRQEHAGLGPCDEFLWQTTSMDFLAKYQFDFNACIHEGCLVFLLFRELHLILTVKLMEERSLSLDVLFLYMEKVRYACFISRPVA